MARKQQLINLLSNFANLFTNILLGLFFTPYLVKTLGIAAYGVLPLALLINSYINVVTGALVGSMSRFYSIELVAEKYKEASEYLSIAFISLASFFILSMPLLGVFIYNIDDVLNIPDIYVYDSKILFSLIIFSFFLSMCSSLLNITQFALNRLDIMNIIKISRNVFKVIFVLLFFCYFDVNLQNIGLAFLLSEIVVFVLSVFFYKKETDKKITISLRLFNTDKFKIILNVIFWNLLLHAGEVVLFRIDNIVINKYWSTSESGVVGVFSEFGMYINSVLAVIISLASPLIVINYSKKNFLEMTKVFLNNYAVTNYFLAIIIATCICFAPHILHFWLDDSYVIYSSWFCAKLLYVPFIIYISIYNTIFRVYNKLKTPSYIMITCGIMGVILMCITAANGSKFTNPVLAVLIAGILSLILNMLFSSIYINRLNDGISYKHMFKPFLDFLVAIIVIVLTSLAIQSVIPCNSFIIFLIEASVTMLVGALLTYKLCLSRDAKNYLKKDLISRGV